MNWLSIDLRDVALSFLSILFEGIPFLLLGSLVSGVVEAYVPSKLMLRFLPKRAVPAVLVSGLLGIIFPICECGSVVVIRRFIRKGLPVSCAVTYMLAAPIVSPVVALSTWAAFKGQSAGMMTSMRLLLGFCIAVGVGFIVRRIRNENLLQPRVLASIPHEDEHDHDHEHTHHAGPLEKLLVALRSATTDFLDVAFFLVIGAGITAFLNTSIDRAVIDPVATNEGLAVVAMMGLAFVLSLCSTSDAFIAASLVKFPFVAKLAFLVFGPMLDVKLIFLYSSVFRKRFVFGLSIGLFVVVALICGRLGVLNL